METVLITGAAKGIGQHLALHFLKKGKYVIATDIQLDLLEQHSANWPTANFELHRLDVRDYANWEEICAEIVSAKRELNYLINNAGILVAKKCYKAKKQDIDDQIDVNVKGVIYGTSLLSKVMVEQGFGHIINIASLAGIAPVYGLNLYCASKFAVRGYTLSCAFELQEHNVHVSVICPDVIDTDMVKDVVDNPDAAMIYSGNILEPIHVSEAIEKAIRTKQMEVAFPVYRSTLAKLGSFKPGAGAALTKKMLKKGLDRQEELSR